MSDSNQLVVFSVDEELFALELCSVERVVRSVEIAHVPDASPVVLGIINVEGRIIPVVNTRKRLRLREREIHLNDLFLIVQADGQSFALVADAVMPVVEVSAKQIVTAEQAVGANGFVRHVAKGDFGMIMILEEEKALRLENGDGTSLPTGMGMTVRETGEGDDGRQPIATPSVQA